MLGMLQNVTRDGLDRQRAGQGGSSRGGPLAADVVLAIVTRSVADIEAVLADFEPGALCGADAVIAVDAFAKGEKLCATGKALAAQRATSANVHKAEGQANPAVWLAQRTGDTLGRAGDALSTAAVLKGLPHLDAALRAGELSAARAAQVADAASANPTAEPALVGLAKDSSMRALRERCSAVKASAGGSAAAESARHAAIHRGRYLRHWSDPDGALRLDARLSPEDGARVLARIEGVAARIFDEARLAGLREHRRAYDADALVELVGGGGPSASVDAPPQPPAQLSVRVDASALRRGFVEGDEVCEIPGVGPVPVASARSLLGDAWLRLVITDGVDIATVCHLGRTITAHLRSAVQERDTTCVVPGCEVAHGLEIDHWRVDVADGGPTSLFNLARLCHAHHQLKTHHGYRLEGGPGHWRWVAPQIPPATGPPRQPSLF